MKAWLVILALLIVSASAAEANCEIQFRAGVEAYKNERYEESISQWNSCLQMGVRFGDLYFNLGNAYYRNGQIGQAIRHYHTAKKYMPTDPDVQANLEFAEMSMVDRTETTGAEENPVLKAIFNLHHALTVDAQWRLIVGLIWIFAILLAATWMIRHERLRFWLQIKMVAVAGLTGILALSVIAKIWEAETSSSAVIITRATDVMSGPGEKYQVLHELHEGTTVEVREQRDKWVSIRLGDQVAGFVSSDHIGMVE